MVVSAHPTASQVGLQVLRHGGNAVDAAVAVGFALAVVYPEAGNIGGGGFMLIHQKDGDDVCVDFRETAPARATRDMFLDSTGNVTDASINGYRSVAVPGTVHGLLTALQKYGRMSPREVVDPSVALAKKGLPIDYRLAKNLAEYAPVLEQYPSTAALYFRNGKPLTEGDTLPLTGLAETLERIEEHGISDFYQGPTASLIAAEMARHGGILSEDHLANYRTIIRKPIYTTYHGRTLLSIPLPSSGGVCLFEALNILQGYDLSTQGYHSSRSVHVLTETMKRAFADRTLMGDRADDTAEIAHFLSPSYAAACRNAIDTLAATPATKLSPGMRFYREGNETTTYVVADAEGNVAVTTYTLNDSFGSKVIVDNGGFFLNDEMDDFAAKTGAVNLYGLVGGSANAISPGKRPLSSITPVIVLQEGRPILALGARGGSRIISSVLQVIINVLDYRMPFQEAVDAPRFHHQWNPDTLFYEPFSLTQDVLAALEKRGHVLKELQSPLGRIQAIGFAPDGSWMEGIPDWREGGAAEGD